MEDKSSHWITISDMMSGIMMIFMMIAIAFMVTLENEKKQLEIQNDKMRDLAQNYSNLQQELYKDLMQEFGNDLKKWDAFIDEDTTIRFQKQDILFDVGQKRVKERFQKILDDFFPRYVRILYGEKYRDFIEDIRIEGHTSKDWEGAQSLERRYLGNAELSQERAFQVLKYCFSLPSIHDKQEWLIGLLRANGVSFAKPLASDELSRRVEFQASFKANEQIRKILQAGQNDGKGQNNGRGQNDSKGQNNKQENNKEQPNKSVEQGSKKQLNMKNEQSSAKHNDKNTKEAQ